MWMELYNLIANDAYIFRNELMNLMIKISVLLPKINNIDAYLNDRFISFFLHKLILLFFIMKIMYKLMKTKNA